MDEAIAFLSQGRAANPAAAGMPALLAAAFGLKGDLNQAKAMLAEFAARTKIGPPSFARFDAAVPNWNASPEYVALRKKTIDVGLRAAGVPEE